MLTGEGLWPARCRRYQAKARGNSGLRRGLLLGWRRGSRRAGSGGREGAQLLGCGLPIGSEFFMDERLGGGKAIQVADQFLRAKAGAMQHAVEAARNAGLDRGNFFVHIGGHPGRGHSGQGYQGRSGSGFGGAAFDGGGGTGAAGAATGAGVGTAGARNQSSIL